MPTTNPTKSAKAVLRPNLRRRFLSTICKGSSYQPYAKAVLINHMFTNNKVGKESFHLTKTLVPEQKSSGVWLTLNIIVAISFKKAAFSGRTPNISRDAKALLVSWHY